MKVVLIFKIINKNTILCKVVTNMDIIIIDAARLALEYVLSNQIPSFGF